MTSPEEDKKNLTALEMEVSAQITTQRGSYPPEVYAALIIAREIRFLREVTVEIGNAVETVRDLIQRAYDADLESRAVAGPDAELAR